MHCVIIDVHQTQLPITTFPLQNVSQLLEKSVTVH